MSDCGEENTTRTSDLVCVCLDEFFFYSNPAITH